MDEDNKEEIMSIRATPHTTKNRNPIKLKLPGLIKN